ncbi:TPA: hypothetical protein N0F65_001405, partial [Lagenidium giganteum]
TGDWKQTIEQFERRIRLPRPTEAPLTTQDVHDVIKVCFRNDRHREARDVLNKARTLGLEPTLASYSMLCCVLVRKGSLDKALETIAQLHQERDGVTVEFYNPMLDVLKEQNDWQGAHRVVQHMHSLKMVPSLRSFRVLMLTAAKAKRRDIVKTSIEFLEKHRSTDVNTDVPTLTAMCQALNQLEEYAHVLKIYRQLDRQWRRSHGNTFLFNNFIVAMGVLEEMATSMNALPDDFTYGSCMNEAAKRDEWDRVIDLFNQLQEQALQNPTKQLLNPLACTGTKRSIQRLQREMKIVLRQLPDLPLTNKNHVMQLIDALDELYQLKHGRALFQRLLNADMLPTSWLRHDGCEIDLHSFSRGTAKCAVLYALAELKRKLARQEMPTKAIDRQSLPDVRIITGVGKHSKTFLQPVVRDEIHKLLVRSMRPSIRTIAHPTNPGVLLVPRRALAKWLAAGEIKA